MRTELDLSISIVTYKTTDKLALLLDSIVANIGDISYEILIVDNGNEYDVVQLVRCYDHALLISNSSNQFFTRADNQNLARAKGKYILTINSDTIIIGDAIKQLMLFLDYNKSVGAVIPKICYPNGDVQISFAPFVTRLWGILEVSGINAWFPNNRCNKRIMPRDIYYDPEVSQSGEVLYGCCIFIRKEVLQVVGLKDEKLIHGWDEYDWCKRIRDKGWKLYYVPQAKIIHFQGESRKHEVMKDLLDYYYWEGLFYLFQKYYGAFFSHFLRLIYRSKKYSRWARKNHRLAT